MVPKGTPETDGPSVTRRRMLKLTAAGGATVAGLSGAAPDRLDPAQPGEAAIVSGTAVIVGAGLAATAYGAGVAAEKHFGSSGVDEDEYLEKQAETVHNGLLADAEDMAAEEDSFFTQINNVVSLTQEAAVQDANTAGIEAILADKDKSTVISDGKAAVDQYFTTNQKNILKQVGKVYTDLDSIGSTINSTSNLSVNGVVRSDFEGTYQPDWLDSYEQDHYSDTTVTLFDGSSYTLTPPGLHATDNTSVIGWSPMPDGNSGADTYPHSFSITPVDSGSQVMAVDLSRYRSLLGDLQTRYDNAISQVDTLLGNIYDKWEDGTIGQSDLIAASDLASISQESDDFSSANATLASLGVPVSDPAVIVELQVEEDDGSIGWQEFEGVLAMRSPPDGGLPVGEEIDPSTLPGPVWFSYNYETESGDVAGDQAVLQDPFRITQTETGDDTVTFSDPVTRVTETDLSIDEYRERVMSYKEAEGEARKETVKVVVNDGGGGSLFSGFDPFASTKNTVITVAGAGAALIGIDKASGN